MYCVTYPPLKAQGRWYAMANLVLSPSLIVSFAQNQGSYSQHFIFFETYEYAGVLHNTALERLTNYKHPNSLVQIVSYEENKEL